MAPESDLALCGRRSAVRRIPFSTVGGSFDMWVDRF